MTCHSWVALVLFLVLPWQQQHHVHGQPMNPAPPSGCSVCASSGDCSHAFKGSPGLFCGTFQPHGTATSSMVKPCCCPIQSSCRLSNDECQCHYEDHQQNNNNDNNNDNNHFRLPEFLNDYNHRNHNNNHDNNNYRLAGLLWLAVLGCCLWCCISCCCGSCCGPNNNNNKIGDKVKYVVLQAQDQYPGERSSPYHGGTPREAVPLVPPPALNPNYLATATAIPIPPGSSYATGATTTALPEPVAPGMSPWVAGLGGLATGAALGSVVAMQVDDKHFGNYSDDPYGGNSAGMGGGGYDFAGDTGDGYDVEGDS